MFWCQILHFLDFIKIILLINKFFDQSVYFLFKLNILTSCVDDKGFIVGVAGGVQNLLIIQLNKFNFNLLLKLSDVSLNVLIGFLAIGICHHRLLVKLGFKYVDLSVQVVQLLLADGLVVLDDVTLKITGASDLQDVLRVGPDQDMSSAVVVEVHLLVVVVEELWIVFNFEYFWSLFVSLVFSTDIKEEVLDFLKAVDNVVLIELFNNSEC